MKINQTSVFLTLLLASLAAANAAPVTRSGTADNLNLVGAWVGAAAPTTAGVATWDASSTLANTMGANNTWGGLDLSAAAGAVSISGNNTLTLDHATDADTIFNAGAGEFTWGVSGTGGAFNIVGALATAAPGPGNTGVGATFAGSGVVTLSSTGTKNWSSSGSAINGANGVTNVTFTGTVQLRGGTTAIETTGGNWFALGGGGGTTGVDGAVTQTGAFRLDTGDAASRGDFILTHGINNKSLQLVSLSGTGNLRADWGVGATLSNRGITLQQTTDTVFAGGIYMHNGSGQRRNVTVTKEGSGKLTFIGRLGSGQATAGNPASLNFAINGGVWQMGDGTENPSAHLNAANWDSASTFTVGSGATLRFMAGAASYTWDRAITGGTGLIEITSDGDPGEGNVVLTANNSAFAGNVNVLAGSLRIGPNLGSGTLTMTSGSALFAGLPATNAVSQVGALVLEGGTESDFRLGTTNDRIDVTGGLTAPAAGTHTINLLGTASAGGTLKLIDFSGTPLSPDEFARFALGLVPAGAATYQLINNPAETSLDLLITLENQLWKGSTDGNWDGATPNWALAGTPGTPVLFNADHPSLFDDNASITAVIVDVGGVFPTSVTFANANKDYVLTGGEIGGGGGLAKIGAAKVTLAQDLSYTGGTTVNAGTLMLTGAANFSTGGLTINAGTVKVGDGGATGDIGSGAVVVAAGATLEFNRSNATPGIPDLNYQTSVKLRNVSGAGGIVLTGGAILYNYPGTGVGFGEAGSWAGFSGNLTVKGGSEFRTIRNGATAMGSGDVILGDATTSGILAQSEGNWTWTNDVQLVGADNKILNRSGGTPPTNRTLKLQGVISGGGGLTLEDAAGTMNVINRGFILTAANTLTGALTIALNTPVRVGGVPGNSDVNQPNADAFGTLGSATVVNHGTLTFSRTDAHTVANAISGTGALRVGIPLADGLGDTGTQVLTLTGTASHTGTTTVNNGKLIVAGTATLGGSSVTVAAPATVAGTGVINAPLAAAGTVAPGDGIGELKVTGNTDLSGTLAIELDGTAVDRLAVTGDLDLDGSTLTITPTGAGFTQPSYVIATCTGALTGTPMMPPGYLVSLQNGQVLLSQGSDYESWLGGFSFAPGADTTPTGDPDGDGLNNQREYAFGLDPTSGNSVSPITSPLHKTSGLFTYTRRLPSLTGLTYAYEASTTLSGAWTAFTPDSTSSNSGNPIEAITVKVPAALLAEPVLFVRVSAVK